MSLKMKKGPDFSFDGEWLVLNEQKEVVARVYFDRQYSRWCDADKIGSRYHSDDYMGNTKADMLDKVSRQLADGTRQPKRQNSLIWADGVDEAKELYTTFHQFEPEKIGEFKKGFEIPSQIFHVGEAKVMYYHSDKLNPETGEDEGWIHYFHDHEGGVQIHLTDSQCGGDLVDVPDWIVESEALVRLGDCEGFAFLDLDGRKIKAEGTKPLPEWYATPNGNALLVIQSKRTVIAILWGGTLDVEWRGVVG